MMKATLALTMTASLVGCATDDSSGGRSSARVSDIEKITTAGGTTTIERTELDYDGDNLSQVTAYRNGAPNGSARVTYRDGRPLRIDYADKDGDRAFTTFEYIEDGLLWKTHDEVTAALTQDRTVWYDEKTLIVKELAYAQKIGGTAARTWNTKYAYDSQGRLEKLTVIDGDTTQTNDIRYSADGRIAGMSAFTGSQHDETWDVRYLQNGRLDEITDTHNRTISVSYDSNNMISDIRLIDGTSTESWRYSYEPGSVSGVTFAPEIPLASQFDLSGKSFDDLALMHIAPPIQEDVPHVGGDACVADDDTSCSACLNNNCCASCTTESCYSYVTCVDSCNGSTSCISSCASYYPGNTAFGQCAANSCTASCGL